MKTCNICGKRIKDVKLVIEGIAYDANVSAKCLQPYTHELPEGENRRIVQIVYKKMTAKKKK